MSAFYHRRRRGWEFFAARHHRGRSGSAFRQTHRNHNRVVVSREDPVGFVATGRQLEPDSRGRMAWRYWVYHVSFPRSARTQARPRPPAGKDRNLRRIFGRRRHRIATDAKEIDSLIDRPEPVGRGRQPDCFSGRAREINSLLSCSFLKVSGRGGSCSRLVCSPGLGFRLAHTVVSSLDTIAIHAVDLAPNPARRCSLCSPSAQVSITLPQSAERLSLGQCVDRTPHLVIDPMCPPSPPGSRPSIVTAGSLGYKLNKNATT